MTVSLPDYFHDRIAIDEGSDCWLWIGPRNRRNWGLAAHRDPETRTLHRGPAHRIVWGILRGPIPKGMQLDHLCRVRCCVNPNHLEVTTARTNLIRGKRGVYDRSQMSSRLLGVRAERGRKWVAQIHTPQKRIYLGTFADEVDAGLAYDAAVRDMHGPDAPTNQSLGLLTEAEVGPDEEQS